VFSIVQRLLADVGFRIRQLKMTSTSRLDALEMLVAEQQRVIDDLSDGLLRQQKELDRLTARLRASDDRIVELESGLPAPDNEKPPHW